MRKVLFNLHLYGALIAGLFVVVIGVTGSIMAFEPELDRLTNPSLFRVEPQGEPLPASQLFQAASRAYPNQKIAFMRMPQSATDSAQFNIKGPKQVFLNPYTGDSRRTQPDDEARDDSPTPPSSADGRSGR